MRSKHGTAAVGRICVSGPHNSGRKAKKSRVPSCSKLFFTLCHVAATNGKLPHEVESAAEREAATAEAQAAAADEAAALSGIPAPNAPWADLQVFMQQTLAEIKGEQGGLMGGGTLLSIGAVGHGSWARLKSRRSRLMGLKLSSP